MSVDYKELSESLRQESEWYKTTNQNVSILLQSAAVAITELIEREESLRNQRVSIQYEDEILTIPEMCKRLRWAETAIQNWNEEV